MTAVGETRPSVLDLRDVWFRHPGSDWLFRGLNLSVSPGEVVVVVGPSGCGKSTLLRIAAGLVAFETGERRCSARTVTQVFQTPRLLPWRTALDNVTLPLQLGSNTGRAAASASADERSRQLLESVGLGDAVGLLPRQLSLGMQMRVALARALAPSPEFMLLDEPFAAVDEPTRLRLNRLFVDIVKRERCAALYVTHSAREATAVGDRIIVVDGRTGGIATEVSVPRGGGDSVRLREEIESRVSDDIQAAIGGTP